MATSREPRRAIVLRMTPEDYGRIDKVCKALGVSLSQYTRLALWRAVRAEEAAAANVQAPEVWGLIRDTIMAAEQERLREDENSKA